MRKTVILLLGLLWATGALAQYVPEWYQGDLRRKGTRLAVQGEKLDAETTRALLDQVGGPGMVVSWNKYAKERGWGIGLTAGGYTLAAAGACYGGVYLMATLIGIIFAAPFGEEAANNVTEGLSPNVTIGAVTACTGLAAGTTGVVLLCAGNRNLRKLTAACNAAGLPPVTGEFLSSPQAELTFGPTPSGLGLALRF